MLRPVECDPRNLRREPRRLLRRGLLRRRRLLLLRSDPGLMAERLVLFVCVKNAARSLIAEAAFNADPAPGWRATSAGTRPGPAAHRRTGPMLREVGLALPDHPPQALSDALADRALVRVTMGCLDDASCPVHLKKLELRDWGLEDPEPLDDAGFRRVRDQIRGRVAELRSELLTTDRAGTHSVPNETL